MLERLLPAPAAPLVLLNQSPDLVTQVAREEIFFRALRLANGTYKTTARDRMTQLDQHVASLAPKGQETRILDIGVSSAITTYDLASALTAAGAVPRIDAVDLTMDGTIVEAGKFSVLFDSQGFMLQVAVGPHGRGRPHIKRGALSRAISETVFNTAGWGIRLFAGSPKAVSIASALATQHPQIRLQEADLFVERKTWLSQYWLVRAANILNLDYFDTATLRRGVDTLKRYVQPNGYFLINRTNEDDGANNGTLFQLAEDSTLRAVHRFGRGSELDALILGSQN